MLVVRYWKEVVVLRPIWYLGHVLLLSGTSGRYGWCGVLVEGHILQHSYFLYLRLLQRRLRLFRSLYRLLSRKSHNLLVNLPTCRFDLFLLNWAIFGLLREVVCSSFSLLHKGFNSCSSTINAAITLQLRSAVSTAFNLSHDFFMRQFLLAFVSLVLSAFNWDRLAFSFEEFASWLSCWHSEFGDAVMGVGLARLFN